MLSPSHQSIQKESAAFRSDLYPTKPVVQNSGLVACLEAILLVAQLTRDLNINILPRYNICLSQQSLLCFLEKPAKRRKAMQPTGGIAFGIIAVNEM